MPAPIRPTKPSHHLHPISLPGELRGLPNPTSPASPRRYRLLVTAYILLAAGQSLPASEPLPPGLQAWITQQTNTLTWSAGVRQTRLLKAMNRPLTAEGKVWFQAPSLFRWELGSPPQTIAVREPDRLTLLYPRLKRAEVYPLDDDHPGPWRDSLTLLEAGFPRQAKDLQSRFRIISWEKDEAAGEMVLLLKPRAGAARKWIPSLQVTLRADQLTLAATELTFADGSQLRNEFSGIQVNPQLSEDLFRAEVPPDYTTVRPAPGE